MTYPVTEIFQSLIGEGHWTGHRAVFIRLGRCPITQCHIREHCDETVNAYADTDRDDILEQVQARSSAGIVVLTGGEPAMYDLVPLVDLLHERGYRVHIETSGVRSVSGIPFDWITVSPKIRQYVQRIGDELKVIVVPGMTWHHVGAYAEDSAFSYRYIQPLTQRDGSTNLQQCLDLLMKNANWRGRWALSTQAHKVWGVA